MGLTRWKLPFGVGAPVVLALLVAGCPGDNVPEGPTRLALYPECPTHPFKIKYYQITATEDTVATDSLLALPNAGVISDIPEYHDCQQLAMPPGRYVTLAGVFAYEALGTLYQPGGAPATLRAAAEIVAFDGDYRPLMVKLGFNCLYLWEEAGGWRARVFAAGGDPSLCGQVLGDWPANQGHELEVRRDQAHGMSAEDYPPVARWEWDPEQREQFLGIKCGEGWCSVRRPGAGNGHLDGRGPEALPALPPSFAAGPGRWERARIIRGWYDEQRLALPTGTPGQLQFSEIRGTILPHPELGKRTSESDYAGAWTEVARAVLDPATGVEQYFDKRGFRPGVNIIDMQQFASAPSDPALAGCKADEMGLFWVARVTSDGRSPVLRCVERVIHPPTALAVAAPGTARWRWDPDDEKTWVTCPKGCCTVE